MHDLALVFHMYGPTPLSSAYLVSSFVRSFVRTYSGFQAAVDIPEGKIFQNDIFRTKIFS